MKQVQGNRGTSKSTVKLLLYCALVAFLLFALPWKMATVYGEADAFATAAETVSPENPGFLIVEGASEQEETVSGAQLTGNEVSEIASEDLEGLESLSPSVLTPLEPVTSYPAAGAPPLQPLTPDPNTPISLSTGIAVQTPATEGMWITSPVAPALPGSSATMRLTLTNDCDLALSSIRVYDIIPRHNDSLDSWGSFAYTGVSASPAAQIYTSSTSPNSSGSVPTYGLHGGGALDLQDNGAAFWLGTAWSASVSTAANTRAFFVDFGGLVLLPRESVNIDISFMVTGNNQQAFNQFYCSAVAVDNPKNTVNQPSGAKVGFSTNVSGVAAISILYDENLPFGLPIGSQANGIPLASSAVIGHDPAEGSSKNQLRISNAIPTLIGYDFLGWNTLANGQGEWWGVSVPQGKISQGMLKTFSTSGELLLFAQWESTTTDPHFVYLVTINGSYAMQTGAGEYLAGGLVNVAAGTRLGYSFVGWAVDYGSAMLANQVTANTSFIMPGHAVGLTAHWQPIVPPIAYFTVRFLDWDGALLSSQQVAWGTGAVVPPNPVRAGYDFVGWSKDFSRATEDITAIAQYFPKAALPSEGSGNPNNPNSSNNPGLPDYGFDGPTGSVGPSQGSQTLGQTGMGGGMESGTELGTESGTGTENANLAVADGLESDKISASVQSFIPNAKVPLSGTTALLLLKEEGVPVYNLGDHQLPLHGGSVDHMVLPLANLVLGVTGAVLALVAAAWLFSKRRQLFDTSDKNALRRRNSKRNQACVKHIWASLAIVLGVLGITLFIATQNRGLIMVLFDRWTVLQAIIFLAQATGLVLAYRQGEGLLKAFAQSTKPVGFSPYRFSSYS